MWLYWCVVGPDLGIGLRHSELFESVLERGPDEGHLNRVARHERAGALLRRDEWAREQGRAIPVRDRNDDRPLIS